MAQTNPKNIVYDGDKTHKSYLTHTFQTEFNYTEVNEEIILNIIDNLKNSNSCGFDDLSTNTLKSIKHSVTKPLAIIINQIFNTVEMGQMVSMSKYRESIRYRYQTFKVSKYRVPTG